MVQTGVERVKCAKCGARLSRGDKYCIMCGAEAVRATPTPRDTKPIATPVAPVPTYSPYPKHVIELSRGSVSFLTFSAIVIIITVIFVLGYVVYSNVYALEENPNLGSMLDYLIIPGSDVHAQQIAIYGTVFNHGQETVHGYLRVHISDDESHSIDKQVDLGFISFMQVVDVAVQYDWEWSYLDGPLNHITISYTLMSGRH